MFLSLKQVPVSEVVPESEAEGAGGRPREHVRGQGARRQSGENNTVQFLLVTLTVLGNRKSITVSDCHSIR